MNTDKLVNLAIIAAGAYIVYKVSKTVPKVGAALNSVGSAIGSGLYDLFHKDQTGEMLYYTPVFPDGSRHAIASGDVSDDGKFFYMLKSYQLVTPKDGGLRRAIAIE